MRLCWVFFGLVGSSSGAGCGARLAGGVAWPAPGGLMRNPTIIRCAATVSTTADARAEAALVASKTSYPFELPPKGRWISTFIHSYIGCYMSFLYEGALSSKSHSDP